MNVDQITLPLTVAYVTAIVKWFFDTGGMVSSEECIGLPLVVLVSIIVFAMMSGLIGAVIGYEFGSRSMTPSELGKIFIGIEMVFGGMFGIIMSELFGAKR